jgi:hypothetical protein
MRANIKPGTLDSKVVHFTVRKVDLSIHINSWFLWAKPYLTFNYCACLRLFSSKALLSEDWPLF